MMASTSRGAHTRSRGLMAVSVAMIRWKPVRYTITAKIDRPTSGISAVRSFFSNGNPSLVKEVLAIRNRHPYNTPIIVPSEPACEARQSHHQDPPAAVQPVSYTHLRAH